MIKTFDDFLHEDLAYPSYLKKTTKPVYAPTLIIDQTIKTHLYHEYKFPDGLNPRDLEEYVHTFSSVIDDPKPEDVQLKGITDLYDSILMLNPELKGIAGTDRRQKWMLISGALSGFIPEDIRFWIQDTNCEGYQAISPDYRRKVTAALGIVSSLNGKYIGGYLPSPSSLRQIEQMLDGMNESFDASDTKVTRLSKATKQQHYLEYGVFMGMRESDRLNLFHLGEPMIEPMKRKLLGYKDTTKGKGLSLAIREKLVENHDFLRAFVLTFFYAMKEIIKISDFVKLKPSIQKKMMSKYIAYFCTKFMDKYSHENTSLIEDELQNGTLDIYDDVKDSVGGFPDEEAMEPVVFEYDPNKTFLIKSYKFGETSTTGKSLELTLEYNGNFHEYWSFLKRVREALNTYRDSLDMDMQALFFAVEYYPDIRERSSKFKSKTGIKEPIAKPGSDVEIDIFMHDAPSKDTMVELAPSIIEALVKAKIIKIDPSFRGGALGMELGLVEINRWQKKGTHENI